MDQVRVYMELENSSSSSGNSAHTPPFSSFSSYSYHFSEKVPKVRRHKPALRPRPSNGPNRDRTSPDHRQSSSQNIQQQSTPVKGLKCPASSNETAGPARRKLRSSHRQKQAGSSTVSAIYT